MSDDRPNQRALAAVDQTISDLQAEAYAFAKTYVLERRPETVAKMRELKEVADLLTWARDGSPFVHDEDGWPT
jgi:hypothetical protein